MLSLFPRRRYGPIGLDVGSRSIKLLQLGRTRGRLSVAAAAQWQMPDSALGPEGDAAACAGQAAEAVRSLLKQNGFHGREVVSCLRMDELATKNVRLPHMPKDELDKAVLWECQERLSFPVAADRIHYFEAGDVRQGTEVRDEIIIMAVPESTIQQHLDRIGSMRLEPVHIDTEPTALFRAYQRYLRRAQDESVVSVIVDIGLTATKVVVAKGKKILLIKLIDLAGRALNESVAKELGLTYSEAAHFRRRLSESRADASGPPPQGADQVEWSVLDAIRVPVEALAREISLCLRYCSVTFRGLCPNKVTLTGGEAYDPAAVKLLTECLGLPCAVGQPLRGVEIDEVHMGDDRRSELTEWSVVTGLALRGLVGNTGSGTGDNERSRLSA